jgi:hypothetical protein
MRIEKTIAAQALLAAISVLLMFSASGSRLQAQVAGNNAVYTGSPTAVLAGSSAYIDATAWAGTTSTDFCGAINQALNAAAGSAAVIDARGLNSTNTSMSCSGTNTPWSATYTITSPSTILLPPAASTPITISATWVLPNRTRIVGAGRTLTTIQVSSGFTPTTMIQMGNSTLCPSGCTGVVISDLRLDGQGTLNTKALASLIGIMNKNSQEGSYVSHVTFRYFEGTSLDIETSGANNSGPYEDNALGGGGSSCVSSGVCSNQNSATSCIKIVNAQTHGIHGFTCTAGYLNSSGAGPSAGLYLDGNGNSIQDGHFEGVKDGVVVGDQASVAGNVILNITGASGGGTSGDIVNIVHICNPATSSGSQTAPCTHFTGSVTDLSLSQIQTYTSSSTYTLNAIQDDETSTTLTGKNSGEPFYIGAGAGLYVLGESDSGGYSRFNTFWLPPSASTAAPIWGFANNTTTAPTGSCPIGSIFSNGGGSSGSTLYVCVGGTAPWANLK